MKLFSKELLYRILPVEWTQPTLTSNGVFGGNQMAVDWALGGHNWSTGTPYQAFAPNGGELYVYADEYKTWMRVYMYIPRPVRARNISFSILWVNSASGPATNVKFYGGNGKGNDVELLKDIGYVGENVTYNGAITTNNHYQYYTLYLENGGGGNNDSLDVRNIRFTGEYDDFI